jgi:uracil-DNA glycosylase
MTTLDDVLCELAACRVCRDAPVYGEPLPHEPRPVIQAAAATFYDARLVAIVPMGHCFPGQNAEGADLPPRRECAPLWRDRIFSLLARLELVLLIGSYAQNWHLGDQAKGGLTATVARWREILAEPRRPALVPLPHPSWRNNGWLKANPWFEEELLPELRKRVEAIVR